MLMNTPLVRNQEISANDVVTGTRALRACDELLEFLGPVLKGTRREGDRDGVTFLVGLMADLGALADGLRGTLDEH